MNLFQINWRPTNRELRQFGGVCMFALPLLSWVWGGSWWTIGSLAAVGVALASLGAVVPVALIPPYLLLTVVATPIGLVVGELMLVIIYFGVFLPIGMLFRWMQRDALGLEVNRARATYWHPKKLPCSLASYYRQS